MLGIILPTLNAQATLAETLVSVKYADAAPALSIVVADGGSTDQTRDMAQEMGARVTQSAAGRGRQLASGAAFAKEQGAGWFLFLHADTRLPTDWGKPVTAFMLEPDNVWRAAHFQLALDDPDPQARRVEKWANWRANSLGLPYGDQGLLISADLYEMVGGYSEDLDLMEDVGFIRNLKKTPGAELVALETAITTSAARYLQDGWWLRPMRNLLCLALFLSGAKQDLLKRLYQ